MISTSTATGCARNAAFSAFSGIRRPPPSRRSGLHALQHRGQEAAGIVSFDGRRFNSERRLGLVGDHFSRASTMESLKGHAAVGHVRYSTTGETILRNVQPLFAELSSGGIAVAPQRQPDQRLDAASRSGREGAIYQSTSDTEVILHLVARSRKARIVERFVEALRGIEGAYALVALTNKKLIGARDPLGIRPLVLGMLDGHYILASETCALDIIGAHFVRDIENGEVIVIRRGHRVDRPFGQQPARPCIFEYIYFARPDSIVHGRPVYDVRKKMGAQLALKCRWRPTWSCRCPIPACRRPSATRRRRAFRSSSASSATIMSGAPSSSRRNRCANSACA
jgi:amidophosphoribosyltransferase